MSTSPRSNSSEARVFGTRPRTTTPLHRDRYREYFIQLWGAELWDAAVTADVDRLDVRLLEATTPDIYRRLDIAFYEPRV